MYGYKAVMESIFVHEKCPLRDEILTRNYVDNLKVYLGKSSFEQVNKLS